MKLVKTKDENWADFLIENVKIHEKFCIEWINQTDIYGAGYYEDIFEVFIAYQTNKIYLRLNWKRNYCYNSNSFYDQIESFELLNRKEKTKTVIQYTYYPIDS